MGWRVAWTKRARGQNVPSASPERIGNGGAKPGPCGSLATSWPRILPSRGQRLPPTMQQALALAEELGMRPLQAHCHRGLGTLYARQGQQQQARAALAAAIDLYRDMDMTFWLPQAEAALAQVV